MADLTEEQFVRDLPSTTNTAVLSTDGRYRYALTRTWNHGDRVLYVMLNPSTADATQDDPTIRRCTGFAREWGYGSLEVVNLFAWRATDPADILAAHRRGEDIVGPDNDRYILEAASRAKCIVVAWGAVESHGRDRAVASMLVARGFTLLCLGRTKGQSPRHPLMLRKDARLEVFAYPEASSV